MIEKWQKVGVCPVCGRAVWQIAYCRGDMEYCSPLCLERGKIKENISKNLKRRKENEDKKVRAQST